MRFKKGGKVEVLRKRGMALESWCPAEILSGNGHTYYVRYETTNGEGQPLIERVPRKAIRPCPPLVGGVENLLPGDMVEVFDSNSWKIAEILNIVQVGFCFFVQIPGSLQGFRAYASNVRIRHAWLCDEWVLLGKVSRICEDEKSGPTSMKCFEYRELLPDTTEKVGDYNLAIEKGLDSPVFHKVSSRSRKRGPKLCSTDIELQQVACKKMRLVEKDARDQKLTLGHSSKILKKVDVVASPENCVLSSFGNRTSRSSNMDMEKGIPNLDERFLITRSPESEDDCSIASCSATSARLYKPQKYVKFHSQDRESHLVDTESSSGQVHDRKYFLSTKVGAAAGIHRLELHAYRSTLEALYASGPLSWEHEAMMTNLRIELHISNDEHLLELRHLVSSKQTFL